MLSPVDRPDPAFSHARMPYFVFLYFAIIVTITLTKSQFSLPLPSTQTTEFAQQNRFIQSYGQLPLTFEANIGQTADSVSFLSRGPGFNLYLSQTEATFVLDSPLSEGDAGSLLRMQILGSNTNPVVSGISKQVGQINYFIGNDPAQWHTNIPTYAKVQYEEIYPGIDLIYYGNQSQLEYDFIVSPGVDPNQIALSFDGAESLEIVDDGRLLIHTTNGTVEQQPPIIYQEIDGERMMVEGRYNLSPNNTVGFTLSQYNTTHPLTIDPILVYATYVGGGDSDNNQGLAVDGTGNTYITGRTQSLDFPTTAGALSTTMNGSRDIYVVKLDSTGSNLVYATYIGGSDHEQGDAIDVDSSGNVYITGNVRSIDFPVTTGAFDETRNSVSDSYILKLDASGANILYASYLGGGGNDNGFAVMVDSSGQAHVAGYTFSADFPTTAGAHDTAFNTTTCTFGSLTNNCRDVFVVKLDAAGTALQYGTFIGGSGDDFTHSATLDSSGNVYVSGTTDSTDFPTTTGAYSTSFNGGNNDGFVAKLNTTGTALAYGTYLGGSSSEVSSSPTGGITVDTAGNAYITGLTYSADYPTTAGAFDTTYAALQDAYITKLNSSGSALVYSTFIGGNGNDSGWDIAVDTSGRAYLTGNTNSGNMPITGSAFQPTMGGQDAYLVVLNATGTAVEYGSFFGGIGHEIAGDIELDSANGIYLAGVTNSTDFPATASAFDQTFGGGSYDSFIAKVSLPCIVTSLSNFGAGSLREAINCANSNPGPDTIVFNVAGTINISGSQLPTLNDVTGGTFIDGTTAPGYAGSPVIILDGPSTTGSVRGLHITSADNTIHGLQINDFSYGIFIENAAATGNAVTASYIGTDGTTAVPNLNGIVIDDASNNIIGTDGDGVNDTIEGNIISGNNALGVQIIGALAANNIVAGNLIGTDASGTADLGNLGQAGVQILLANNNRIGTNGDGLADSDERNIISGNDGVGIYLQADDNVVAGNYIGTDISGTAPIGNSSPSSFFKAAVFSNGNNNLIGTDGDGVADTFERNIISATDGRGVYFGGGSNNTVAGNYIGTDVSGVVGMGNSNLGIYIASGANHLIGTDGDGIADADEGNVISANGNQGILIQNTSTTGTVVAGNIIGLDATGTVDMGNSYEGIQINNASNSRIGTDADGVSDTEERNTISGNGNNGVSIFSSSATGTVVAGNYIGTDISGIITIPNDQNGVGISNAPNGRIGGNNPAERNIISGNSAAGIRITGSFATGNAIEGNYIGTDVTGLIALGNATEGILIGSSSNFIGGTTTGAGNVIADNGTNGISISNGSTNNIVQGNFSGTDATGTVALPNTFDGITIGGDNNLIGGATVAARNVFSGNTSNGISISSSGNNNQIKGNFIGTDVTGIIALSNGADGIQIGGANNIIGGTAVNTGNVISTNTVNGIRIIGSSAEGNVIQRNFIGTDLSGTVNLGNGDHGIRTTDDDTTIGGIGVGNIIANNNNTAIQISVGTGNAVLSNSIYNNTVLGIDLSGGGLSNDSGDGDSGANNLQNFPELTLAELDSGNITIEGTLDSAANTTFTVQFFSNSSCHISGNGEGETLIATESVLTNASGAATFSFSYATMAVTGDSITATATDPGNNTSEFSTCQTAVEANDPPTAVPDNYTTPEDTTLNIPVGPPITTIQPTLPTDLQFSNGGAGEAAPVAFDGSRYLTVYRDGSDMYGRFIDTAGVPSSPFLILGGSGNQGTPDIAFNGTHYLVTFNNNGIGRLQAQVIDTTGLLIGSAFEVLPITTGQYFAKVATDGTDFLVVWQDGQNYATNYSDTRGQFIAVDGAGTASLTGTDFLISPAAEHQFFPAIEFGGGTYLVTWTNDPVPNAGIFDVKGALVSPAGSVSSPIDIGTATSFQGNRAAGIGFDGTNFLVVFDDSRNGSADVYGMRVSTTGALLDGSPATGGIQINDNPGAGGFHQPQVGYGNGSWLVVWNGGQTQGTRVASDGSVIDTTGVLLSVAPSSQWDPSIAFDGTNFLVTWRNTSFPYPKFVQLISEVTLTPGSILSNDSDPEGDGLTAVQDTSTSNGSLIFNSDGSFDYTPNADFCGTDSFTYHANDGALDSNIVAVTIDVTCVNDTPEADDDTENGTEDTDINIAAPGVLDGDSDDDGDSLTAVLNTTTTNGTLTLHGDGSFDHTPNADFCGTDSFTYHANDGTADSNIATVTLNIACVNDAPLATADTYSGTEDIILSIPTNGILGNDSDADGDSLTAVLDTTTTNGTLTLHGDGSFDYTPNANFCGIDSFTYHANDTTLDSNIITVTLNIACDNDAPIADDDSYNLAEDGVFNESAPGVLDGDSDGDGDSLTAVLNTTTTNGTLTLNGDGSFDYTPDADFCSADSFTYHANDGTADSNIAIVTLNVACVNDAPVSAGDGYSGTEDIVLSIPTNGVLGNDSDVDGDSLTAVLDTTTANGTLTLNSNGSFDYTSNANSCGADSFSYHANDGQADSNSVTVSINIACINDAPDAVNDSDTTDEDTAITIYARDNDTDPENDALTITAVTPGNDGTTTTNSNDITYTPDADFCGSDSFSYTISDGNGGTDSATVNVTVNCVNDAPVANDDLETTAEDTAVFTPVLSNDTDTDGDTLTISSTNQGLNGSTLISNTNVIYTPNANYCGADSYSYTISDGNSGTDSATVSVTIDCVNDAPIAASNTYSLTEDGNLNVLAPGLLADDSDVDGDSLTAVLDTTIANGTLTLNSDGSFDYTPTTNFCGSDGFTYFANDGQANSNAATVTLNVACVNDAPDAMDDNAVVDEDDQVTNFVLTNDNDVDGDSLTIITIIQGTIGSAINNGTSVTYVPNADECGSDSYSYTISDSNGGTDSATVNVTINCFNDAPLANDDSDTTNENMVVTTAVLGNDSDVDGDTLTVFSVMQPLNGTAVINPDNSITYTPDTGYTGTDTYEYTISDGNGGTDIAQVTITISSDQPKSDLSITKTDTPDPITVEEMLTYIISVTNHGPSVADFVTVIDTLPAEVAFEEATTLSGSCIEDQGTVTCDLGTLNVGQSALVTIVVIPEEVGQIINNATVSSDKFDPNLANNDASEATTVTDSNTCHGHPATIIGTKKADVIIGTSGDDVIIGRGGADFIDGQGGNDIICGGRGHDTIFGGSGNDIVKGNIGHDTLYGGFGNDQLYGGRGNDDSYGEDGDDVLYGRRGNDLLVGGSGQDEIHGGRGLDTIQGNSEADDLYGGRGNDLLEGAAGDDYLRGGKGQDILYGGLDNDTLYGNRGQDTLYGGSGTDNLSGGNGHDWLFGGTGDDVLNGGNGNDDLDGGPGTDTCTNGEWLTACEL